MLSLEVAEAAEHVSLAIRRYIESSSIRPLISSACPAIVRLIQVRFPELKLIILYRIPTRPLI